MDYSFFKTEDGSITLINKKYKDFYHSKKGAIKEALYQFLFPIKKFLQKKDNFLFLEIGFGLGYNFLVTTKFLKRKNKNFKYYSLEKDKELIKFLKKNCSKFKIKNYCKFLKESEKFIIFKDATKFDFETFLKKEEFDYFIIYHDGFSPSKNKELWDYKFLKKLNSDIVVTYTSNPKVRNSLILNGFYILPTYRIKEGSGTVAFKEINDIQYLNYTRFKLKEVLFLFSNYGKPYNYEITKKKFPFLFKNGKLKIKDKEFFKKIKEIVKGLNSKKNTYYLNLLNEEVKNFWA